MSRTPALPLTSKAALRRKCSRILSAHRQRARAEGKTLNYGRDDLIELARQLRCNYCRLPVGLDFQLDHRNPIARGGFHEHHNLTVSCSRCNQLKGRLTDTEFMRLRDFLEDIPPAASDDLCRRLLSGSRVYTGARRKKYE